MEVNKMLTSDKEEKIKELMELNEAVFYFEYRAYIYFGILFENNLIEMYTINKEFFEILEYLKIPIIIHTDFSNQENVLSYNSAFNWLECLKKYDIKSYFAHAARLSEKCIDIIEELYKMHM